MQFAIRFGLGLFKVSLKMFISSDAVCAQELVCFFRKYQIVVGKYRRSTTVSADEDNLPSSAQARLEESSLASYGLH